MSNILLIAYDNGSHIPFFPINLFYLMGALDRENHKVGLWHQDLHHGSEDALIRVIENNKFDVIGLGFCAGYYQYQKAKKISEAINVCKHRDKFIYVLGGHGPAGAPEFFMRRMGADAVVVGDGEDAICEIADSGIKGIIIEKPTETDLAPIQCYRYFPMDIYRLIRWPTSSRTDFCFPILSSRGCRWNCSFCYRMRKGFHERAVEAIMQEITFLHNNMRITHFQFADELLMSLEKRIEEICESILKLPFEIKWDCNGRLNFATSEALSLMKRSGAQYVNYGIESLDPSILREMGKGLSIDQIYQGVQNTVQAGLSPGLNFIWGFPGDTRENLFKCVDFIKQYDPCDELRTIRPVTPYPGCRLWFEALEKGLVKDAEDFYETKHLNSDLISVNFMDMPVEEAHKMLWEANRVLWFNYLEKRTDKLESEMKNFYFHGDITFRGFRAV